MTTLPTQLIGRRASAETVEWIRSVQLENGMVPWFAGGHGDPWNHVEAAMALTVGGATEEAARAFSWLQATQLACGAWHTYYLTSGEVEEPRLDTNVSAYVATGLWHHYLATGDDGLLEELWPMLERAVDFAVCWQRPGGELAWCVDPDGTPAGYGLLTGSSSAYLSLRCAIAAAAELGLERPSWELAAGLLSHAIAHGSEGFADKDEFAMDWYYPVLVGALAPAEASRRIERRWDDFVIEGRGVRCVLDRPWVTAAETAECAMALFSIGWRDQAANLLAWAGEHRLADGSYVTGLVHPERVSFPPGERSSYTAAAVVLAEDALSGTGATAQLFAAGSLPTGLDLGRA